MASDVFRVHVVCEGPSDYAILEASIAAILDGADFVLQQVQPESSKYGGGAGPHGGGWKGVRSWCAAMRSESGRVSASSAMILPDVLIIHVDADVASDPEISCAKRCPPASATVNALKKIVLDWAGEVSLPPKIVICIPSKNSDAWVLAALYPNDAWINGLLECRPHPEVRLLNKPEKLARHRDGSYQKHSSAYREIGPQITAAWGTIKRKCKQAREFENEFVRSIAA